MKEYLENINKAFESKARLGIMSILIVNESVDFVTLKNLLDLTDGNLASHTRSLEDVYKRQVIRWTRGHDGSAPKIHHGFRYSGNGLD